MVISSPNGGDVAANERAAMDDALDRPVASRSGAHAAADLDKLPLGRQLARGLGLPERAPVAPRGAGAHRKLDAVNQPVPGS
jgi:hypothetical protein